MMNDCKEANPYSKHIQKLGFGHDHALKGLFLFSDLLSQRVKRSIVFFADSTANGQPSAAEARWS